MENLISQKFTKSLNVHLAFLFVLSLSYIIPFLIFGKITLFYHDTLDSEIVYNSILGKVYRGDAESIKYFLNGEFKVEFLRRLFHPINLLYYFFNPEIAYWINDFTVKILAYFSFYIFAKKISSQIFICGLVSCLYASINDRTLDGFGFAIIPYIIYLISFKKNIKIKHFLIVAVLGANTDLVYIMPVIPAVIAVAIIINKKDFRLFLKSLLAILSTFIIFILIFNYNLIYSLIIYDDFHRASFYEETLPLLTNFISYLQSIVIFPNRIDSNFPFIFPKLIIFAAIILITLLERKKKPTLIFVLILLINFFLFVAGLSFINDIRNSNSSSLISFQFERISLLTPLLYSIILIFLLDKKIILKKTIILISIFSISLSQINASITPAIKKYFLKIPDYRNVYTFNGYYMYEDYRKIKSLVQNNRVLSVGLDPMVAVMNNIYVIDGYHNLYPLSYKIRFRKIINKELEKNEEIKKYYDNWGSRVYAFINDPKKIELDFYEAKKIGAKFVISKYIINTSELALIDKEFNNKIFLYKIN